MDWSQILTVGAVLIGGGGIAALATSRSQAAKTAVETYDLMVQGLRSEVSRMGVRITQMGTELVTLQQGMAQISARAQRAEQHASSIHDWIERGMEPPPPQRPAWLPPTAPSPGTIIEPPRRG